MSDRLYTLNPQSAIIFTLLIGMSVLICHYGMATWTADYWELQRQVVAAIGILANFGIIYYHVTTPPHPKFLLSPKRKFMVRAHATLGISEVLLGIAAVFFPESGLGAALAVFAILHAITAFIQSPAVFGAKAIMIPSYFFASTLHIYCGVRLMMDPMSAYWIMNTFLTLNIYAYVRVFMLVFEKTGLFRDNHYSASVLFSGVPILPALMGPIGMLLIAVYIWIFILACKLVFRPSAQEMDELWVEHVRVGLVNEHQKNAWLIENLGELPQGDLRVDKAFARKLFDKLDVDNSNTLEEPEMIMLLQKWGLSKEAVASIMRHAAGPIGFDKFFSLIRSANLLAEDLRHLKKESCETDEERARIIFQELDFDNSGFIERVELEMLLLEYGLPKKEVESYLARHDGNGDGKISFPEFQKNFEPLWKFAYYTVN